LVNFITFSRPYIHSKFFHDFLRIQDKAILLHHHTQKLKTMVNGKLLTDSRTISPKTFLENGRYQKSMAKKDSGKSIS